MLFFFTIRLAGVSVGVWAVSLTLCTADCTLGVFDTRGGSGVFFPIESVDGLEACFFTESGLCGIFFFTLVGDFGTLFSAAFIGLGAILLLGIDISPLSCSTSLVNGNGSLNLGLGFFELGDWFMIWKNRARVLRKYHKSMRYMVFSKLNMNLNPDAGEVTERIPSVSSSGNGDEEKTPTMLAAVGRWRGWRGWRSTMAYCRSELPY